MISPAERYLLNAISDAISPIVEMVEAGDTDIERYEPDVAMDLTDAYREALDMEIKADTVRLSSEAHMDTILTAVNVAFMELSCQKEMGISPVETIDMLADALLQRLQEEIDNHQAEAAA